MDQKIEKDIEDLQRIRILMDENLTKSKQLLTNFINQLWKNLKEFYKNGS
ncbi:hypothetical protein LCGC14_1611420 [marine sediment metagenome]|uniref:Uncharacterized protein n=1 Tax=marine sediment metagenome TaxID=412755 RepID=A0A0F9L8D9_9ZZZZ